MKRSAIIAVLSLWPAFGWSSTAVVTGGEHSDFTRLVVTLPNEVEWRVGRADDGYTLSIDENGLRYDLQRAFTRIPKTRLADVAQVPETGDLHIVAACPCYVTAFAFRPNVIVLDIRDGAPPEDSAFEAPLQSFKRSTLVATQPAPLENNTPTDIALDWTRRIKDSRSTIEKNPNEPITSFQSILPKGFEKEIASQLGAAATQGLVTLAPSQTQIASTPEPSDRSQSVNEESQFRIATEAGMDMRLGGAPDVENTHDEKCFPDDAVDIASWGNSEKSAAELLTHIRNTLVTDADRLPALTLREAAKTYLYLGFGAEAQLLLSGLPVQDDALRALKDIGAILDGTTPRESAFENMETCENASALWSVAARKELRPSEPIASGAIVQAFSGLPYRLREILAARVIERLREQGDGASAQMIRDTINRVVSEIPPSMAVIEAQLKVQEDQLDVAKATLEEVTSTPGPNEAKALIALVQIAFEQRSTVNQNHVAALEALLAQTRSQEISKEIREALVISYSLGGDFKKASELLVDAPGARESFWHLLAENASDAEILDLAFDPPDYAKTISQSDVISISRKLLSLGFPEKVLAWLQMPESKENSLQPEANILIAEAHLSLFQPQQALSTIAGMDESADLVRAHAMEALGNLDQAAQIMESANRPEKEISSLKRRDRQWGDLAKSGNDVWAQVASIAANPVLFPQSEGPVSLALANELVTKSTETRRLIDELLME